MMHGRDYVPNNEDYIALGSNQRSDIGVNTYLCVAAHLKCLFMR